mmetsp:Transcript_6319/g.14963  ORF Transcript_6319/g.14963 Transcript_6319/m.14963 type:complete len:345 (+) Transcript_6319:237-1271(+)
MGAMVGQQLVEAFSTEFCHANDIVGPSIIQILCLVGAVGSRDKVAIGPDLARNPQQFLVCHALQQRVGDGGDHYRCLPLLAAGQVPGGGKIPPTALDPLLTETRHSGRVDVDDVDPAKDGRVPELELRDEHCRNPVEAKEDNVLVIISKDFIVLVQHINVLPTLPAQLPTIQSPGATHQAPDKLAAVADRVAIDNGQNSEGPDNDRHGFCTDMTKAAAFGQPHAADYNGKLANLGEVDRGYGALSRFSTKQQDQGKDAQPPYGQDHHCNQQRRQHCANPGDRYLHAHASEEERDEEVAYELDLAVEILTVGEGGQRGPSNERRHLHGQTNKGQDCCAAQEEAPG